MVINVREQRQASKLAKVEADTARIGPRVRRLLRRSPSHFGIHRGGHDGRPSSVVQQWKGQRVWMLAALRHWSVES